MTTPDILVQSAARSRAARDRFDGRVLQTPLLPSATLPGLFYKCENFQRTGSFKIRGAMSKLTAGQLVPQRRGFGPRDAQEMPDASAIGIGAVIGQMSGHGSSSFMPACRNPSTKRAELAPERTGAAACRPGRGQATTVSTMMLPLVAFE